MTIRLLTAWNGYPANALVTLDAGTETGLVTAKLADTVLTGGLAYTAPVDKTDYDQPAKLRIDPLTGAVTGLVGPEFEFKLIQTSATVCIIGNSLGYKERRTTSGAYLQSQADSLFAQINARMGQKFKLLNLDAEDGITFSAIVDKFETGVRSHTPDYVVCLGTFENDVIAGTSAATASALLDSLLSKCRSIGAKLIVTTVTPGGTVIVNTTQRDKWYALERLTLDAYAGVSDVCLLRTDTVFADPTATYPSPISGGYTDGAWHWYQRGAAFLADMFASQISDFVGGARNPFDGTISASMTDLSVLTPNQFLTGTTAGGGNLTGTLPGSGVTFAVNGTGSGVASLVSRLSEGVPGNYLDIAYTGPASAVWNTDRIRGNTANVSLASAGLAVGDVIQGIWECEVPVVTKGLMGIQVFVIFTGSSGTYGRTYANVQNNGAGVLSPHLTTVQGKRYYATPPLAIPVGTTGLQLFVEAHPTGANAAFTARFGRHRFIKLDSTWY